MRQRIRIDQYQFPSSIHHTLALRCHRMPYPYEYRYDHDGKDICDDCRERLFRIPQWAYEAAVNHEPPTDTDVHRTLRRLADIDKDIEAHERQVEWLSQELSRAQEDLDNMMICRESYLGIVRAACPSTDCPSPADDRASLTCNTLPNELWIEIFHYVLDTYGSNEPVDTLQNLSLVCCSWHQLVNSSAVLWARINLSSELGHRTCNLEQAQTFFERSNALPLELILYGKAYERCKSALDTNMSRVEGVELKLESNTSESINKHMPFLSDFSQLRRLHMIAHNTDYWFDNPVAITARTCFAPFAVEQSRLTFLHLDHVRLTGKMPLLPSIRHLTLRGYKAPFMRRLISVCPGVMTLHISEYKEFVPSPRGEDVHTLVHALRLRELRFVELSDGWALPDLLGLLSAPVLEILGVCFDSHQMSTQLPGSSLATFVADCAQSLKVLELEDALFTRGLSSGPNNRAQSCGPFGNDSFYQALSRLKELEVLTLLRTQLVSLLLQTVMLLRLHQIKLAVLDDNLMKLVEMLQSRNQDKSIFLIKVIDLLVFEDPKPYWKMREEPENSGKSSDSWLDGYSANHPDVLAKLDALRQGGATVSCFSYPRFHAPDFCR